MDNTGANRSIAIASALLGLSAFVGVLVLAPVETPRERRSGEPTPPGINQSVQSVRAALADGRTIASLNIAQNAVANHPQEPDAWMWLGITAGRSGDAITAMDAGKRLLELLAGPDLRVRGRGGEGFTAGSDHLYRVAWGHQVQGDVGTARAVFAEAADTLEREVGAGDTQFAQYNLACYRAMAGQLDRAADHFARAVEGGYGRDNGWWKTDPDLDPLREHPVFVEAGQRLENRARNARSFPETDGPATGGSGTDADPSDLVEPVADESDASGGDA